ncbi:hypothetical protein LTR16_001520 [Cryomyces antarcticus]|uniref:Transmembrane protein n=1 Tax=Cryomyces antarcticus TaxID=329879 RepID=A0ABR0LZ94_9PEZI|nr:hypothetical protein LTR39_000964 [Cryomyces antarcticus]KAK5020108.1 hypothetical protein LTR60_000830 [Cryomyces antarcticus]KAK5257139.1 hypothetical protein LTR16_001520 [Cryomyces antarcticus]
MAPRNGSTPVPRIAVTYKKLQRRNSSFPTWAFVLFNVVVGLVVGSLAFGFWARTRKKKAAEALEQRRRLVEAREQAVRAARHITSPQHGAPHILQPTPRRPVARGSMLNPAPAPLLDPFQTPTQSAESVRDANDPTLEPYDIAAGAGETDTSEFDVEHRGPPVNEGYAAARRHKIRVLRERGFTDSQIEIESDITYPGDSSVAYDQFRQPQKGCRNPDKVENIVHQQGEASSGGRMSRPPLGTHVAPQKALGLGIELQPFRSKVRMPSPLKFDPHKPAATRQQVPRTHNTQPTIRIQLPPSPEPRKRGRIGLTLPPSPYPRVITKLSEPDNHFLLPQTTYQPELLQPSSLAPPDQELDAGVSDITMQTSLSQVDFPTESDEPAAEDYVGGAGETDLTDDPWREEIERNRTGGR